MRNRKPRRYRKLAPQITKTYYFVAVIAVALVSSCSNAPRYRSAAPTNGISDPDRQEIVRYARSFVGAPYRNGGSSSKGFDCSGLVMTVYDRFDIPLPRTSLDQSRIGKQVDRSSVKAGDLVFFKTSRKNPVSHVGIYIGEGRFIHASTSARRVRIDEMSSTYFRKRYVTARRVVNR